MTVKEKALSLISSMPSKTSMDEIIHALYVHTKFQHGENEIRRKKGISHEDAKKRFRRWVK